jgi:membrane protein implicated in regulation of membrane protease activity
MMMSSNCGGFAFICGFLFFALVLLGHSFLVVVIVIIAISIAISVIAPKAAKSITAIISAPVVATNIAGRRRRWCITEETKIPIV